MELDNHPKLDEIAKEHDIKLANLKLEEKKKIIF